MDKKIYSNNYDKKEDALEEYGKELYKNDGDINKALLALNKDGRMPFGFLQYFKDHIECINYLRVTEDEFNEAECVRWNKGVIERHHR